MGLSRFPQVLTPEGAKNLVYGPQRGRLRPIADAAKRLTGHAGPAGHFTDVGRGAESVAERVDQVHGAYGTLLSHSAGHFSPMSSATFFTMQPPSSLTILAENLGRIVAKWNDEQRRAKATVRGFGIAKGMTEESQWRALGRALKGETVQLDTLEMIATHVGFEPWKLLHPKFDPDQPLEAGSLSPSASHLARLFDSLPVTHEKLTAFSVILEICERTARGEVVSIVRHGTRAGAPPTPSVPSPAPTFPAPTAKPPKGR